MRVNPIVFYEVLLNSTIDKVFEFNDVVIFYNIVIPGPPNHSNKTVVLKLVKKGSLAAMFINDVDRKDFDFEQRLKDHFNFIEKEETSETWIAPANSINESMAGNKDWRDSIAIMKQEELNIDYIVFMISEMGVEVIEDTVYKSLWDDTLNI